MFEKLNIFKRLKILEEETEKIRQENNVIVSDFEECFSKFICMVRIQNLSQKENMKLLKYMNGKLQSGMKLLGDSNTAMGSLDLKSDLNVS